MQIELIIYRKEGKYYPINCYILGITFKDDKPQLKVKDEFNMIREFPINDIFFNINQIKGEN